MIKSPFTKIVIIIIIALVIPLISYVAFQVVQNDKNEQLIVSVYERQLESILFSINQYCWDLFSIWSSHIGTAALKDRPVQPGRIETDLEFFVNQRIPVTGAFVKFSQDNFVVVINNSDRNMNHAPDRHQIMLTIEQILKDTTTRLLAITQRSRQGYVQPLAVKLSEGIFNEASTLLLFPIIQQPENPVIITAGIFVNDRAFIQDIIVRKFTELEAANIIGAVIGHQNGLVFYASDAWQQQKFEKFERLWLLPHLELHIKIRGKTLAQVAKARSKINLIFLLAVTTTLLSGIVFLLRNIIKEMKMTRMKTDFVANVSHELRTPLALIRMFAETLELGRITSEEKKNHYYRTIVNESTRLTQLINNILDFSKIESGRKKYHLVASDLAELVHQVLETYRFHLEQNGFQIEHHIDAEIPRVNIDSEAISQVLVNLLDNAVKFCDREKKIIISLKQQNRKVVLAIQDTGCGIPEAEQKKIFEKFHRVESSLVHNTKGSGLGLTLVKHIMEIHHGQVTVASKPGSGSTFYLLFPVPENAEN